MSSPIRKPRPTRADTGDPGRKERPRASLDRFREATIEDPYRTLLRALFPNGSGNSGLAKLRPSGASPPPRR